MLPGDPAEDESAVPACRISPLPCLPTGPTDRALLTEPTLSRVS